MLGRYLPVWQSDFVWANSYMDFVYTFPNYNDKHIFENQECGENTIKSWSMVPPLVIEGTQLEYRI